MLARTIALLARSPFTTPAQAGPEIPPMARTFKSFVDDAAAKANDQDAKAAAAKAADQALIDAQTATGSAYAAELAALQAIGGQCGIVNSNGSITRYYTDKTSPTGFSAEVLPDGATAEVPDPAPQPDQNAGQ
jgi:hypothetical protein